MFCINDDGMFEHQGRTDDMLKISGQWVSPSEIEEKVLEEPEVLDAAVVGVPNEDGLIRLALFVVAPQISGSEEGFEKKLMDRLSSELSIYKCPRKIFYRESLPQTATGKLQRFELRKMVMENQTF
jgi:benzoate-CoA ligase